MRFVNQVMLAVYRRTPRGLRARIVRLLTPNYTVGVVVLLVNESNQVLFVRLTYRKGWGLPGGLMRRDEMPRAAGAREIEEELGIRIEPTEPYRTDLSQRHQTVTFMMVARVTAEQWSHHHFDPVEIAGAQWFPVDDMPALDPDYPPLLPQDRQAIAEFTAR